MVSARTLDDGIVAGLVRDATAAPSMHNAQPWRFHYTRGTRTFGLYADRARALPHADPSTRGLHIGCGAALLNLRVAAAHAGLSAVTALLPVAASPEFVATVHVEEPSGRPTDGLAVLYPAIHDRHTSRYPFTSRLIPDEVRCALGEAAHSEDAFLTFPTGAHLRTVLDVIRDAEGYDHMDADREAETARWTRNATTAASADGIPDYAFGPIKRGGAAPARDFAGSAPVKNRAWADFEETPQLAVVSTETDEPGDWLRAGQAMERVLLTATLHRLSTSFATQPLEWPELRWVLRDPVSGTGHVQMVIRLGYGPTGARTPRRPVEDVLTVED
ncbi:nitroreductase [Streptomyces scopuliridis]|uniref:Nitroreductase n=1 Tax=Streptomyces scopuliridis TaxID=452529 RepID=A0ACD4ZYC9_9ACTN|nr:nitroreductase [Streptomyces scopuliridis]WSC10749.1 nitroreductase [Streptomyces scopuliridis]